MTKEQAKQLLAKPWREMTDQERKLVAEAIRVLANSWGGSR